MLKLVTLLLCMSIGHGKVHFPGREYYTDLFANKHHRNSNETLVIAVTTKPEVNTIKIFPDVAKVRIKVFYETLCPASVEFLTKQLKPVVETMGSHLDVHLVPFGHAEVRHLWHLRHRYTFRCQRGPAECFGNKLHACSIHVLNNATAAVLFNSCLMTNTHYDYLTGQYDFYAALTWCGSQYGVNADQIRHCSSGRRGSELLKVYGDQTKAVHPSYVPYVLVDDSTERQDHALVNFMMTVCSILRPIPPQCFVR